MEMITHDDFPGVAEDVARRLLVEARSIAPCIDSFEDESEDRKNALAILRGIAAEAPAPGSRRVRSQAVGPARVDYANADTWTDADRNALRSLCGAPALSVGPIGSFPVDRPLSRIWPETYA